MKPGADTISTGNHRITSVDLGRTPFRYAWELQKYFFDLRSRGECGDLLLVTEHNHVYTVGKSGTTDHLLAGSEELRERDAEVFLTDRGGDVTYHGPGQLVAYPILGLMNYYSDIHRYLRELEEVVIRTIGDYNIEGKRDPSYTGVWVGNDKIAAIGVRVRQWTTMHGLALNCTTDLSYFDRIIPCGIFHKGVTSVEKILGRPISPRELQGKFLFHFGNVFDAVLDEEPADLFLKRMSHDQNVQTECLH